MNLKDVGLTQKTGWAHKGARAEADTIGARAYGISTMKPGGVISCDRDFRGQKRRAHKETKKPVSTTGLITTIRVRIHHDA